MKVQRMEAMMNKEKQNHEDRERMIPIKVSSVCVDDDHHTGVYDKFILGPCLDL